MKVGKKLPFGFLSHCKLGIACYCSLTQAFLTGPDTADVNQTLQGALTMPTSL